MLEGYWISPSGKMIEIPGTHIEYVVRNPETFGYTRDELQSIADKHGELINAEGKARDEVMTDILKKEWIRVRYDKRREWVLQIWTLSKRIKDNLSYWIYSMVAGVIKRAKKVNQHTQIFLMELKANNNSVIATFRDILSGKFYEILAKARDEGRIIIEEDVDLDEPYVPTQLICKSQEPILGLRLSA